MHDYEKQERLLIILISCCLAVVDAVLTLNYVIDQRHVRGSTVPDKTKLCFHAGQSFSIKII